MVTDQSVQYRGGPKTNRGLGLGGTCRGASVTLDSSGTFSRQSANTKEEQEKYESIDINDSDNSIPVL